MCLFLLRVTQTFLEGFTSPLKVVLLIRQSLNTYFLEAYAQ